MCRPRFGVKALPCCGRAPSPARGGRGGPPSAPTFPGEPDRAQQGPGASLPRRGHQLPFPDPDVLALLWSRGGLYVAGEGRPPCPGGLGVRRASTGRGGSPAMVRGPNEAAEPGRHHEPRGPSLPWCWLEGVWQRDLQGCALCSRPPRGEGRSTRKLRPCGAPRSCFHSGSWCWQRAAWSTSTGLDAGCASSGLPRAPRPSPSCSVYTSPSSPPATATVPAAPTGPSTEPPTAAAPGRTPPGLATPAALAGSGPAGCQGPVGQQYASHHARMEGAVSSLAAVTALQDGRATPARQMWTSAAPERAAVPSAVSTQRAVTGASVGRGTAHLWTGQSACLREEPPG